MNQKLNLTFGIAALAGALALAVPAAPLVAQSVDSAELSGSARASRDVNIEASKMRVLEDQNRAIFTGKVNATRGSIRLNCDKLIVAYVKRKKKDGSSKTEVTHLDATGNVEIITPKQRILGQWAKMDVRANKLLVGGNVVVHQGPSVIRGDQLTVDLRTNESQISGGRVKGSFSASQ